MNWRKMRQQTNQLLKSVDKNKLSSYLDITENELSKLGFQEIYSKFWNMQEKTSDVYYRLVEEHGLSLYLLGLEEDEVTLDFRQLIEDKQFFSDFFEDVLTTYNISLNPNFFESWNEFFYKGRAFDVEEMFENNIFVYKNEDTKDIQVIKPVLIIQYEDAEHHEYRYFDNYSTNIRKEFELDKFETNNDYRVYCYYVGLYQLSGEVEIFSINNLDYKMRNLVLD